MFRSSGFPSASAPAFVHRPTTSSGMDAGGEPLVGLAEFGAILRKRWIIILASTALTTGLGLAFLTIAKPIYAASTSVFVDPRNRAAFMIEGTGSGAGYDPNLVDSQVVIIESDTVLKRVVDAEKLLDDAELTKGTGEPLANVMSNLKKAVKVKRPEKTYVVEIEVRTGDATKSARLANAIARAYLNDGQDSKSDTARREGSWLETHLGGLQSRLREAENRVEAFKAEYRIVGVDGKLVDEQRLVELNRSIVEIQRRTTEAKATLDQVELIKRSGKIPDTTSDALKSPVIDRLRGQLAEIMRLDANSRSTLGPRHPASIEVREQLAETRRMLNEELARIADGAKNAFTVAQANEAALERQIEGLKKRTTSNNQTMVRLRDLERAVDAQKAVYQKFLSDKEQIARLSVDTPAGRVIAPAVVPQSKAFPNKILVMAIALIAGLFGGVGLALATETVSRSGKPRTRSAKDTQPDIPLAQAHLAHTPGLAHTQGLAQTHAAAFSTNPFQAQPRPEAAPLQHDHVLAVLPSPQFLPSPQSKSNLRWISGRTPPQGLARPSGLQAIPLDHVLHAPQDAYTHAVLQLGARLRMMMAPSPSATILLTGLTTGSGTSTLATNLAWALAEHGERVLLIDANPGQSALTGRVPTEQASVAIEVAGASRTTHPLMGAGRNGPYFLPFGSPRRSHSAGAAYQEAPCPIILIDAPPLSSPALARMNLGAHVDGVIVVLPPNHSPDHPAMLAALERQFGPMLMGVVAQAA